ncbi:MAG: T9SS type A sorting domain-containing protein [Saprospiraceae bacterium]
MKKNNIIVRLFILALMANFNVQAQTQIGSDIIGQALEGAGTTVAISMDGNRIAYGAPLNFNSYLYGGLVKVYDLVDGDWVQIGNDIEGEDDGDEAGRSIALSADGSRIAVGMPENDANGDDSGKVKVYELVNNQWILLAGEIQGEMEDELCGESIALSADGNRLVVSSPGYDEERGRVRTFDLVANEWVQLGQDFIGGDEGVEFGHRIALSADGTTMSVVALFPTDFIDPLFIYGFENDQWNLEAIPELETFFAPVFSPMSFSENGDKFVIGSPWDSKAIIYLRVGSNWFQFGETLIGEDYEDFGSAASLTADGNYLAVGIARSNVIADKAGALRMYDVSNPNTITPIGEELYGDTEDGYFGKSAQLIPDGNRIIIGSPNRAVSVDSEGDGLVQVFDLSCFYGVETTETIMSCSPYTWIDGNTYTSSNNSASISFSTNSGCDSIVNLDLTIQEVNVSVDQDALTLTAEATDATYQWLDCDNNFAEISGETDQQYVATQNGNYAVVINDNGCADTSACFTVATVSTYESLSSAEMQLYPNPTNNFFSVLLGRSYLDIELRISNSIGQQLFSQDYSFAENIDVNVELKPGVYFVSIFSEGEKKKVMKLIRN